MCTQIRFLESDGVDNGFPSGIASIFLNFSAFLCLSTMAPRNVSLVVKGLSTAKGKNDARSDCKEDEVVGVPGYHRVTPTHIGDSIIIVANGASQT